MVVWRALYNAHKICDSDALCAAALYVHRLLRGPQVSNLLRQVLLDFEAWLYELMKDASPTRYALLSKE